MEAKRAFNHVCAPPRIVCASLSFGNVPGAAPAGSSTSLSCHKSSSQYQVINDVIKFGESFRADMFSHDTVKNFSFGISVRGLPIILKSIIVRRYMHPRFSWLPADSRIMLFILLCAHSCGYSLYRYRRRKRQPVVPILSRVPDLSKNLG